jgi:hypothetical protein
VKQSKFLSADKVLVSPAALAVAVVHLSHATGNHSWLLVVAGEPSIATTTAVAMVELEELLKTVEMAFLTEAHQVELVVQMEMVAQPTSVEVAVVSSEMELLTLAKEGLHSSMAVLQAALVEVTAVAAADTTAVAADLAVAVDTLVVPVETSMDALAAAADHSQSIQLQSPKKGCVQVTDLLLFHSTKSLNATPGALILLHATSTAKLESTTTRASTLTVASTQSPATSTQTLTATTARAPTPVATMLQLVTSIQTQLATMVHASSWLTAPASAEATSSKMLVEIATTLISKATKSISALQVTSKHGLYLKA